MNTQAVLLEREAERMATRMNGVFGGWHEITNADLYTVLRQCGIDPDTLDPKALALIIELARTHGDPAVAIAAAVARMG